MPTFLVTRGLGGSATNMIARGFIPTVRRIIRGGRRFAEKAIAEFEENLKISAMLVSTNGKELTKPIINTVSKILKSTNDIVVKVSPKTLIQRKSRKIKVSAILRIKT